MNSAISYTAARQNFKSVLDKVCKNAMPILVQRKNGGNVVILSEEEYRALDETAYLNTAPANMKHLQASLRQLKKGQVVEISASEL